MASTLVMCVVRTLLWSDCFYLYCVDFGDVREPNPSMVRFFYLPLSMFIQDNVTRRDKEQPGIINDVLSFQSRLFTRHLYSHAWFNMLLTILGSICCCYVNGGKGGSDELLLLVLVLCSGCKQYRMADRIDKTDNDDDESGSNELLLLLLWL